MFRSLFPFRRLLATSFLLVFVNVLAGQCYCATINPVLAVPALALAAPTATPEPPTHPGCHGHPAARQAPAKARHAQAHKSTKPSGKEDCCKDNSAAILKSLTTPGEKQLFSSAPALLPVSIDFFSRPAAGNWDRTHPVVLVLREHLPPKIPDIRIFIQSLIV